MKRKIKSLEDFEAPRETWGSKLNRVLETHSPHMCAFLGGVSFVKFYEAVSKRELSEAFIYGGFTVMLLLSSYSEERGRK